MRGLIRNLVDDAIRYTPPGGQARVAITAAMIVAGCAAATAARAAAWD
ncbi:MAG: hypothetical protein WCB88_09685 [Azonexus sp.]